MNQYLPIAPTDTTQPSPAVSMVCEIRQGMTPWSFVRVDQITTATLRVLWLAVIDPGQPLRVKLPGLQMMTARVTALEGQVVELAFDVPLHPAVFDYLLRTHKA